MNTATSYSNLPLEEIFSDKLESTGPVLWSQQQDKKLSQQRLKQQKVKNEKETKHQR